MYKALKRKFGISAPRMAVHTHIPWYWRWLMLTVLIALVLSLAWWMYESGQKFAGFDRFKVETDLATQTELNSKLHEENATLRDQVAISERQLQIERSTYGDLAKQVKALSDENNSLKEDLAFFQSLLSAGSKQEVSIYRFNVERDALPGEYRYRLLLLQMGPRQKEFQGKLQFIVDVEHDGERSVITIPNENDAHLQAYNVSFKYYQRVEGSFRMEPGAVAKSVQVRVFERGVSEAKLTQTVDLS
ncbi:MAG TPA: DUF6776 family protein [Burkholderiales bacterium]|nr:DUF6776 family protein [Burkholderiales bacterium]